MPRQARLDVPGALHYIMVRGINKSVIFRDAQEGLCLAETARHVGVTTSSIAKAVARLEEG